MSDEQRLKEHSSRSTISFTTKLFTIGSWTILKLPESASAKLPSRGQVMVEATINDFRFQTPLEPDGNWSHWFKVDKKLRESAGVVAGDSVAITIQPVTAWPEPDVPADLQSALITNSQAHTLWQHITPMARWEWVRWIRSTSQAETRKRRIEVTCSKLKSGKRRPCCWNRNLCTEPSVSKNGVLLEPKHTVNLRS